MTKNDPTDSDLLFDALVSLYQRRVAEGGDAEVLGRALYAAAHGAAVLCGARDAGALAFVRRVKLPKARPAKPSAPERDLVRQLARHVEMAARRLPASPEERHGHAAAFALATNILALCFWNGLPDERGVREVARILAAVRARLDSPTGPRSKRGSNGPAAMTVAAAVADLFALSAGGTLSNRKRAAERVDRWLAD